MTEITIEVESRATMDLSVSARAAALAWLNAFSAASDDPERPILFKTLCAEWFRDGVQFIATNGHVLFRTWVPREREEGEDDKRQFDWPLIEEVPDRSIIVMDHDGFGIGFMRSLLRVTSEEGHEYERLQITTAPMDDAGELSLGAEFLTERITLRACGQRIDLRLYEDKYPDWRKVRLGFDDVQRVDGLTFAPQYLTRVGRLRGVSAVDMEFYGDTRHVAFKARGSTTEVRGLIMPMKRENVEA